MPLLRDYWSLMSLLAHMELLLTGLWLDILAEMRAMSSSPQEEAMAVRFLFSQTAQLILLREALKKPHPCLRQPPSFSSESSIVGGGIARRSPQEQDCCRRAQLWGIYGCQPSGCRHRRLVCLRHRPIGSLQPYFDALWLPI